MLPKLKARKAPTGIIGLDQISGGGLPVGRTTLVVGGPGSGKTILALQFLVHGVLHSKEPGMLVAFEESAQRIVDNAADFGWQLPNLQPDRLFIMDAQPPPALIQSGNFDLSGMLAAIGMKTEELQTRRIVFDALDIVMDLLPDEASKRREIYRLHEWLLQHELTAIITAKAGDDAKSFRQEPYGFMQFMVDCALILNHSVTLGISHRNLRVQKFRGSSFDENEAPFVIGKYGFEVAIARNMARVEASVSHERVSSGVARLDTMLGGGYYRGASVLITGFPGTAKTTLSGAFAEAACVRGEATLFVSFDSDGSEIIRNLTSIGIELQRHVDSGLLRMISARTVTGSAETFLVRIKALAQEHGARCLVIDPVSTLSKSGNEAATHGVAERLIDWAKADGITLVCTSLVNEMAADSGRGAPLHISTLADSWIHLNYLVQAGERNRSLSIIKSRGTAHSNQVRELILGNDGVTLADIYSAGGEVLMGTMRWEKESAERVAGEVADIAEQLKRVRLDAEEAELKVRAQAVETELTAKQAEKALLTRTTSSRERELEAGRHRLRELRGADGTLPPKDVS